MGSLPLYSGTFAQSYSALKCDQALGLRLVLLELTELTCIDDEASCDRDFPQKVPSLLAFPVKKLRKYRLTQ